MKPGGLWEPNLGALIGTSIGSISGLFAIGIMPAILEKNAGLMIAHPSIGLCCFFLGGACGWLAGGGLGAKLARPPQTQSGYVLGGLIGGSLPFAAFVLLGWFLWTQ
jgi:hypothetical protein